MRCPGRSAGGHGGPGQAPHPWGLSLLGRKILLLLPDCNSCQEHQQGICVKTVPPSGVAKLVFLTASVEGEPFIQDDTCRRGFEWGGWSPTGRLWPTALEGSLPDVPVPEAATRQGAHGEVRNSL